MKDLKELLQNIKSTGDTLVLLNEELVLGTTDYKENFSKSIATIIYYYLGTEFTLGNFKIDQQTQIGYFDVSYEGEVTTLNIQVTNKLKLCQKEVKNRY